MLKNCQVFLIPIIMIMILLLFTGDNMRKIKENFLGCSNVPNVPSTNNIDPNNTFFDIDKMCKNPEEKKWVPWPCWWRQNQNKTAPVSVGGSGLYEEMKDVGYHEPFKYDGVYTLSKQGDKCNWTL